MSGAQDLSLARSRCVDVGSRLTAPPIRAQHFIEHAQTDRGRRTDGSSEAQRISLERRTSRRTKPTVPIDGPLTESVLPRCLTKAAHVQTTLTRVRR